MGKIKAKFGLTALAAGLAAFLLASCGTVHETGPGAGVSSSAVSTVAELRQENGVEPLKADAALEKAALQQAGYMARSGEMDHTTGFGRDFVSRMKKDKIHGLRAENIAYGRPGASETEIVNAAKRASAHDFILNVTDPKGRKGYEAHVGERGVKLSGGQRQRIAIARMILKDAPILVLDEATSALDSEIEAAIQENLAQMMEGKTVIAIAHRLSTIAALDRLIVVDQGRIVEEGTHDELVRRGGLYAQLWKRQSGGFLADRIAAE
ncbi:MAG: ATP-binding cassette domain-containing protein [Rhizobiales bacterium]|nr:ATP-binding cassette domain-containing protein [Hyphomicrobiales bacterium]